MTLLAWIGVGYGLVALVAWRIAFRTFLIDDGYYWGDALFAGLLAAAIWPVFALFSDWSEWRWT